MADARLIKRDIGRDREIDRFRDLLRRQLEHARRGCHARHGADGDVVEAHRLDVERVADAAEHFISDDGGDDERLAVGMHHLAGGDDGRDIVARMAGFLADVTVVEVEVTDHALIGEYREIEAGFLAGAKNRRRLLAGDGGGEVARDSDRLAAVTAQCAAERVDEQTFGPVHDVGGQVLEAQGRCVFAQLFCDGFCGHDNSFAGVASKASRAAGGRERHS
ncbi:MAG: hypothetical protein WDN48_19235 [Pseudolabrys sp.]